MNTAANLVVYPPQRDLAPAEIRDICGMLAPATAAMNAVGMNAGGLTVTVTAGARGLSISRPDAQAKLKVARDVLRGNLTAAGTIWRVPASALLCLLDPEPACFGAYQGIAAAPGPQRSAGDFQPACAVVTRIEKYQ